MSTEFTQVLRLPSQGLLNPEIPDGEVTQRCMMVADQKFLSGSNQSANQAIQTLIQKTITAPEGFDVSKLTISDTIYLLFKLRILSYGEMYKFRTRCPECGKKIDVTIDLSELPVELLDPDYEKDLVVTLPHTGDTVYTRVLTNEYMEEINKDIKRRKKRNANDDSEYIIRIARSIEKIVLKNPVDGKKELTGSLDIERYIANLTDYDASVIQATRDKISYGIAPTVEYICPECGEYIDINIQFSGEFFRPSIVV